LILIFHSASRMAKLDNIFRQSAALSIYMTEHGLKPCENLCETFHPKSPKTM